MSVCVRSARRTGADFAAFPPIAGAVPGVQKRPPMGGVQSRDSLADERQLARIFARIHFAAHQPEPKVKQVRVHDIALAVVAYLGEPSGRDRRRHGTTADTELAGKAGESSHRIEACVGSRLKHREDIHQIEMTGVEPRKVIVEAEIAIVVAPVPVPRCADAVDERAILEYRKIECSTVPRDELWRIAFDAVEEAPDQLGLRVA